MTDSAYVEYLGIIDQSPAEEIVVDDTTGGSTSDNETDKAETSTDESNISSADKAKEKSDN